MLHRIVTVIMLVSFIAMTTSGGMMFIIERPSFTLQMHPVHKLFGLLMIVTAIAHITLNFRNIQAHLKRRSGVVAIPVLSVVLVLLYSVAVNSAVDPELARQLDSTVAQAEGGGK